MWMYSKPANQERLKVRIVLFQADGFADLHYIMLPCANAQQANYLRILPSIEGAYERLVNGISSLFWLIDLKLFVLLLCDIVELMITEFSVEYSRSNLTLSPRKK